jgi:vacuolar protein-sorting-associated protein 4
MNAIEPVEHNVPWDSIVGLEHTKEELKEAVILPIRFPQLFTGARRPWPGVLIFGGPGCGKTRLAQAIATLATCRGEGGRVDPTCRVLWARGGDFLMKFVDGQQLLRELFRVAKKRSSADQQTLLVIDDVDELGGLWIEDREAERVKSIRLEFLVQLQSIAREDALVVVGCSTEPWRLHTRVRRCFHRKLYVGLPDLADRVQLLRLHCAGLPDADYWSIARQCDGFSGSDIICLCRDAVMEPIRGMRDATHFREVCGPDPDDPKAVVTDRVQACAVHDDGAFECALLELPAPEKLLVPPAAMAHVTASLRRYRPSVDAAWQEQYLQFIEQYVAVD